MICKRQDDGKADEALGRLLDRCDAYATGAGLDAELTGGQRPQPITGITPTTTLSLKSQGINTVIWATGFRPNYPWLQCPVFDHRGEIRHDGGVVADAPGLYVMGLPYLRRRKSTFIDGVGDDARDLSEHLANHLNRIAVAA